MFVHRVVECSKGMAGVEAYVFWLMLQKDR